MKLNYGLNIILLSVIVSILIISAIAKIKDENVYLSDNLIIGKCLIKEKTGQECPSCGLTRSFVSISAGRVKEAFGYNQVGLLLYIAIICQLINSSIYIFKKRYNLRLIRLTAVLGVLACLILVVRWIYMLFAA